MAFSGDTFTRLYSWLTDPQRNEKIFNSRLDDEFGGIATGLSQLAAREHDNAHLADMADSTIKGRAAGGGTGDPQDLTATQVRTIIEVREKLSAARTYYVRTDGSDSNTGLANTSGGAFLTIQKAWDVIVGTLDLGGQAVTVQIADGTYTGGLAASVPWMGGGAVTIQGNSGTPANVIVSTTSANAFLFSTVNPGVVTVKDLKITTTTSGVALRGSNSARIEFTNLDFGACAGGHIRAEGGAAITAAGNYAVSGAPSAYHWQATQSGLIVMTSKTLTISNTPAWPVAFASSSSTGVITTYNNTYSGSSTGSRYSAVQNGVIDVSGAGASALPGNSAGSTATGGQYG